MCFEQEVKSTFGRQQEYRNRDYAINIAQKTNGEFIDQEFHDSFGNYWIVIWVGE